MIAKSRNGVATSIPIVLDAETTKIIGAVNIAAGQTVGTVTTITSLTQMNGQAISMGTGVRDAGTQRVTIATNDSVPVTGTFWQATQPVSGTFWQATQPVSGTFWQATQPVSGTFWQATQPVSGTVTANAGTNLDTSALLTTAAHDAAFGTAGAADAQVRTVQGIAGGTALPVSGTFWQTTQPVSILAGSRNDTFTTSGNGTAVSATTTPFKAYAIQVVGTGGAAAVWDVRLEGSLDGTNYDQILQHTQVTGDGKIVYSGSLLSPCTSFRSRVASLNLGIASALVVYIVGVQ